MDKLLILPGSCEALGGTVTTLSMMLQGIEDCGMDSAVKVLVREGSTMHSYLKQAKQERYLHLVEASSAPQFLKRSLDFIDQQPASYPLLLDNCIDRAILPTLIRSSIKLRLNGRRIYHFCHDLARSHNRLGNLLRLLAFNCLSPQAICNSHFTAKHTSWLMPNQKGVLYQPVDFKRFNLASHEIPLPLKPIIDSGAKIILTPSRISKPGIMNDKNLRALLPVLAMLKSKGKLYHSVIIGEDRSPDQINTKELLLQANYLGVVEQITILPAVFDVEAYYRSADVVVTLAPREPFGRVVVEAIACGIPVLGSCSGGIGEILSQAAPEWQVDPGNPEQVAEAVLRLENRLEMEKTLSKARMWVEAECSAAQYATKIIKLTELNALMHSEEL